MKMWCDVPGCRQLWVCDGYLFCLLLCALCDVLILQGIYTADRFTKSLDYCYNYSQHSKVKFMLVCEVSVSLHTSIRCILEFPYQDSHMICSNCVIKRYFHICEHTVYDMWLIMTVTFSGCLGKDNRFISIFLSRESSRRLSERSWCRTKLAWLAVWPHPSYRWTAGRCCNI